MIILSALACVGVHVEGVNKALKESWGIKLAKEVKEIDDKLSKGVHGEDHFAYVQKLLAKYKSSCSFSCLRSSSKKKRLIDAAELILSIRELEKAEMCNRKGDDIVFQVAGALVQEPECRVVEKLINKYTRIQEAVCKRQLPIMLQEKLNRVDQDMLRRLDLALDCALDSGTGYTEAEKQFKKIRDSDIGPSELCLEDSFKRIPKEKGTNWNQNNLEYGTNKETVEKYLLEPCRHVVEELGDDIFELAKNWIQFHRLMPGDSNEVTQFYQYWAKYEMCLNALDRENK